MSAIQLITLFETMNGSVLQTSQERYALAASDRLNYFKRVCTRQLYQMNSIVKLATQLL